ncbi:MAG: PKD domain-containing protein [Thermoplasmata archaeon]|nr:PKD domain-containing protein [Thermoplasmata archaeon]
MIVVIALVAATSFAAFNAVKPQTASSRTCEPASSYICVNLLQGHDMTLLVPFKTAQAGTNVPFTASFTKGETSSQYVFNFGDGTNMSSNVPTVSHTYSAPGSYIASVTANVGGVTHDNYESLAAITVAPSYTSSHSGTAPTVSGAVVSNSTATTAATAVLAASGQVTISGSYSSAPTNPLFVPASPTITASTGVQLSGASSTTTTATATVAWQNPGIYTAVFVGEAVSGTTTAYQNYTWTVFVAPTGVHAAIGGGASVATSSHPGSLDIYELAPGGSTSEDPAIDYETVGYEPIINVYQTLIQYNGSDSGPAYSNFVPVLAACVPGSPQCTALFNSNLTSGTDYTFVLNSASQFYDSSNGNHWGVYPTDVVFSLARTLSFATQPAFGANNGWIVAQSLLSTGNPTWDGGVHYTLNNTPMSVFNSMSVNETGSCPALAMTSALYHGCVTFHADANGVDWPYFLELISDALGSAIVPCGWFSAAPQDSGIPGWTYNGTAANPSGYMADQGDHPCTLPGGATSSSSPAFQQAISPQNMSPTFWDQWQAVGSGTAVSGHFWGNTQWVMAGSGPYYMADLTIGQSYLLKANPDYVQNPSCTWTGCEPAAGGYAKTVSVDWEQTQLPGEEAYASGSADLASIPATDAALLLQLIQQGKIGATTFPSLSIYFFPFTLDFNLAGAQKYTSNPITVPQDFFANEGVRNFFVNAYPYTTTENTIGTKDGIQYDFNYGGAIPQFMGQYYPTNVSFPSTDPVQGSNTPGSASWWWNNLENNVSTPSSPYYDPELASCTTSNPCQVPFFGETGAPDVDQRLALWAAEVNLLSGGKIKMNVLDIDFTDLVLNSLYNGPGQNPMPFYELGWAPDYPDPTDYMVPLYQPDGSYTHADALSEQLEGAPAYGSNPTYNNSACQSWQDYGYWSNMAQTPGAIASDCQGAAYGAMALAIHIAASTPAGPGRILLYNMIEHIANALALYTYWGQANVVLTYAPWINGATANSNIVIGGGGDQTWYTFQGMNGAPA